MRPFFAAALLVATSLAPACTRADATEPARAPGASAPASAPTAAGPVVSHVVRDIDGQAASLANERGKVLVIVNVASECGYTPQYAELQQLHERYKDKGVDVLAFPSNDFGGQEPGDRAAIKEFARKEYGATFKLFDKVHATGPEIAPLYKTLTTEVDAKLRGPVKWNFEKFIVDKTGHVVARFPSGTSPTDPKLTAALDALL